MIIEFLDLDDDLSLKLAPRDQTSSNLPSHFAIIQTRLSLLIVWDDPFPTRPINSPALSANRQLESKSFGREKYPTVRPSLLLAHDTLRASDTVSQLPKSQGIQKCNKSFEKKREVLTLYL